MWFSVLWERVSLTIALADMDIFIAIAMYVYRMGTTTGQTPLKQAKTVRSIDEPEFIASYESKAEV